MRAGPKLEIPDKTILNASERKPLFDLDLKVITPIFGGSAVAGEVDPLRPVSAKSIRGHLRFWWRACRAASFADAESMYKEEERIWGSTEVPSAVDLSVEILEPGRLEQCARVNPDRPTAMPRFRDGYPPYALFPFQGQARDHKPPSYALEGLRFRLQITPTISKGEKTIEDIGKDAAAALWAWILFGGVGARTRRGCGSLYCLNWPFSPLTQDPYKSISDDSGMVARGNPVDLVPSLCGSNYFIGRGAMEPFDAWETAVNAMRDFRQAPGFGRNPGQQQNRPGRSRWPEPDSIRRDSRTHCPQHRPQHSAESFYPRADLGLPIIFHFKDERAGDPSDCTLQGAREDMTRMASPIILKPLCIKPDLAYPMAVFLNAPHVWHDDGPGVALNKRTLKDHELSSEAKSALVYPLSEMKRKTARAAFAQFIHREIDGKWGKL